MLSQTGYDMAGIPPVGGGRMRPPFLSVSCEATKKVSDGSASTAWNYAGLLCDNRHEKALIRRKGTLIVRFKCLPDDAALHWPRKAVDLMAAVK